MLSNSIDLLLVRDKPNQGSWALRIIFIIILDIFKGGAES